MTHDDADVETVKTYQPFEFDGQAVAEEIAKILNDVAKHSGSEERFKGSFEGPDSAEIMAYYNRNCTVTATITLSSDNPARAWNPVAIPVLYPYHGVFVLGKGNGQFSREPRSKLMTWFPCLKRRPGLWFFHSIDKVKIGNEITAEFVFHNGMRIPCEHTKKQTKDADKTIGTPCLPDGLEDRLKKRLPLNKAVKDAVSEYIGIRCHKKYTERSNNQTYDEQDLETQRLFTYNVFLVEAITTSICYNWFDNAGNENATYWTQEAYSKTKKKNDEDGAGADTKTKVINGLVISSFIRKSILSPKKSQYNWLHPFLPENSVAAISSLTMLSRYGWVKTENTSAASRQNHPSFFRKICPVQTPESAKIGIILNLAAGAKVNLHGHIYESDSRTGLGYSASLIPFYHHTDSARAMLGAKNYVQALPVSGAEEPLVKTGMEGDVDEVLEPLKKLGLLKSTQEFHAPGCNLIVAYMTYDGLNFNDAIVVSESAAEKLASSERDELEYTYSDPLGTKPVNDGQSLQFGEIKSKTKKGRHNRLELGDKLTGRHGNKGVVSAIIPDHLMPLLPIDDRLGETLSGRHVDILLNPLSVISRMNVSQLLESHVGLLKILGITGLPEGTGKPFEKTDADTIRNLLLSINQGGEEVIDGRGQMCVNIYYSNACKAKPHFLPVVVGVQYFVKLNHIPSNKRNIRIRTLGNNIDSKDYDPITWQAKKGRNAGGGQSLGAMEMWALEAYQASKLMEYFLTDAIHPKPVDPNTAIANNNNVSQTFRAMQDWLFAMYIVLDKDSTGKYGLRLATDKDIINKGKELRCPNDKPRQAVGRALRRTYKCSVKNCDSHIDAEGTDINWNQKKAYITVEDLLRGKNILFEAFDYEAQIVAEGKGKRMQLPVSPGQPSVSIIWEDDYRVKIVFGKDSGKKTYYAYYEKKPNGGRTLTDILSMNLCCEFHQSKHLECAITKATEFCECNQFGGLADPSVFKDSAYSWGYIKLQKPVRPAKLLPETGVGDACTFNVLPVLPWMYRSSIAIEKGDPVPSKLTGLYEKIIGASGDELETAVKQLLTFIKDKLSGKNGLMRTAAAGRRVDNSGRMVCIPDPTRRSAGWDECAFSINALKSIYPDDEVIQSITGIPNRAKHIKLTKHLRSKKYLILVNRNPTLHRYNVKVLRPVAFSPYCYTKSPGTENDNVIVVNPLISQSMGLDWDGDELQFFLVPEDCRMEAERLLPTHPENFLSVATAKSVLEFEQDLVLGTFLIGMEARTREIFWKDVHDLDLGPLKINPQRHPWDATGCQQMLNTLVSRRKGLAAEKIQKWLDLAFNWMTITGVTLSYFDLLTCCGSKPPCLMNTDPAKINSELDKCAEERLSMILELEYEYRKELPFSNEHCERKGISRRPGFDIAAMVTSRARGDKQIRQLILSRGFLDPGKTGFAFGAKDFIFTDNLVDGMSDPKCSFYAAMNGRSTMTAKKLDTQTAGGVTNRMVAACRNWTIEAGDCGQEESTRSPATCLFGARQRICQRCYGKLSDKTDPQAGYPIGIIAAQSIGERGTQLSMKGFHTGAQAVDVEALKKRLSTDDGFTEFSDTNTGLIKFTEWLDNFKVYQNIDARHVQLLWRVICESGKPGKQNITRAIEKTCDGHIFASLASPRNQWQLIAKAIRDQTRETPDSPLAKTMLGFVNQNTVPVYTTERDNTYTTPFDDNEEEDLDPDLPEEITDEAPASLRGSQTMDSDYDIQEEDEEDGEVINDTNISDISVRISTPESIIAIIVIRDTCKVKCKVEMAPRAESSSRIAILAEAFASWLAKKETDRLSSTQNLFSFNDLKDMLKAVTAEATDQVKDLFDTQNQTALNDAVNFAKRGIVYRNNEYLPVSSFFNR